MKMNYEMIFFYIFLFIIVLLIIVLIILLNINTNNTNNVGNIDKSDQLINFYNIFKNIDDLDVYFNVGNTKISQGKLSDLSLYIYKKSVVDPKYDMNINFIKIFNNNYDKSTANWYTKNIGIPKYFIFSLFLCREKIFKSNNKEKIDLVVSLLDKIFKNSQNIRDELANGIDVISYNLTYINLQKKYPQYLKEYRCHLDESYMDKNYTIINKLFTVYTSFNKDGFYKDNSFIYHINTPSNMAYLLVLLEDYAFLTKNKIYALPPENIKLISNCIKPFLNNKITFAIPWARGISRQRLKNALYFSLIFYNGLNNNVIKQEDLNQLKYNVKLIKNTFNISTNYLMPMIGTYISYGKSYLDNYSINCLNNFIKIETISTINDGDFLNDVNINNNFNFQFGDEEIDTIYNFFNNASSELKKNIFLSGALLDKDNNLIKDKGWITTFKINSTDIEIINLNISGYINFFFIIDRVYNIVSVIFYNTKVNSIDKICALSLYSRNDIISGYSEKDNNKIEIDSEHNKRFFYTKLNKIINENLGYSYYSSCNIFIKPSNDIKDNYYFMTINKDHKIPEIEITDKIIKYSNNKNKFTITKNIQPEDYNITYSKKIYDVEKMFVLEFEKEKILQYCNYPYYSNTPLLANNKKFILDEQYRYYINL